MPVPQGMATREGPFKTLFDRAHAMEDSGQALTVTAVSSNPGLIPNPTVSYTSPGTTGSLRFTPVANASGTATILEVARGVHRLQPRLMPLGPVRERVRLLPRPTVSRQLGWGCTT